MANSFSSLTVYRLRDTIGGRRVTDFKDFIDPKKKPTSHNLKARFDFEARLFVAPQEAGLPPWVEPLETGFGKLRDITPSVNNSAVLIIRIKSGQRDLHFALTFGAGRFLLSPDSIQRKYGFRVALNAIYRRPPKAKKLDPNPLRSVDSKTVADNVLRTRRQVDHKAAFESFEVDIDRDQLTGLTGIPSDIGHWGARIDGSDALHFGRTAPFDQLGAICLQLEKHSKRLPEVFEWVDNFRALRDPATIERLWKKLLAMVKDGSEADPELAAVAKDGSKADLELAPPELVEWGEIACFAFSFAPDDTFPEPSIAHYREILSGKRKLDRLTLSKLRSSHRLVAFNADNKKIYEWPIFRCLSGEVPPGGRSKKKFILSEGDFFEVATEYLNRLNRDIDNLKPFNANLPPSKPRWSEDRYNKAATTNPDKLLLDKKTVKLTSKTTPIEICDILTSGKALIHVKRKLNSSSLSHLFSQGLVSADLLLTSEQFRTKAHDRVKTVSTQRKAATRFSNLIPAGPGITPSEFTVVYAIIASWNGRTLSKGLPFFSKVNLRHYAHALRRMGYNVACNRIQTAAKRQAASAMPPKKQPIPATQISADRKQKA